MKKIIYFLLIVLIVIVAGGALYLWNKPHRSIDGLRTEHIAAETLSRLFETEESVANERYLNKALTVGGIVSGVSDNDVGQQVILLRGHGEFSDVQITLEERSNDVAIGDSVAVSGFCNGYTLAVILDQGKLLK